MPLARHILVTISESLYTVYIRDFMRQTVERQHNTWFRDQVEAGRQQLERGDVLPHDMVESSAAAWRDEMSRKVAGK